MRSLCVVLATAALGLVGALHAAETAMGDSAAAQATLEPLRAPAVPLVTCDP